MIRVIKTSVLMLVILNSSLMQLTKAYAQAAIAKLENIIRIDQKSGRLAAIYNIQSRYYDNTLEQIVRQYLLENRQLLQLGKDLTDLKLLEVKKESSWSSRWVQTVLQRHSRLPI